MSAMRPSPEQQQVIDTWGVGMSVLAGAGSGKTTTLVSKCVELIRRHPQARFVAVSFTERSAADLWAKLSDALADLGQPGAIHQHWVTTIHGLCRLILEEYPREAGLEGEEQVLSDSESQLLWEQALESLWLDELPKDLEEALNRLLDRESQRGLAELLKRVRELSNFGALDSLEMQSQPDGLALAKVSRWVLEQYSRLKRRRGAIDFSDLELFAARALESNQVQEAFHRRFELILVDEFQDTNPIQAQLIWKLARPQASNLCVVGDPKQSIYRFRDADVSVFDEYCARLPVKYSLTWNFRSRPGIIECVNRLCEPAFQASQMPFEALIPQRDPAPFEEPVIQLRIQHPGELAQWLIQENQKGIPFEEMALLVRKIRGNESWFRALSAQGIPLAFGSGGLFWSDPRVRELVAFLRWWSEPRNRFSGAVFLRAPWMGIPDATLDEWRHQDPTWRMPFLNSSHPVALRLKPFIHSAVRPGELLLQVLGDELREQELWAPLLGLWHRLEEYSSQGFGFEETMRELSRAVEEGRREREVPSPRQMGQLSVLTFHGAKGLEFPHVILIDFPMKPKNSDAPLLFWDRTEGAFLGLRDEDGQRDRKNRDEIRWRSLEKTKNLAESKRLFYVALTRARERLVLTLSEPLLTVEKENRSRRAGLGEGSSEEKSVFDEDHWRAWVEFTVDRIPVAKLTPSASGKEPSSSLNSPNWVQNESGSESKNKGELKSETGRGNGDQLQSGTERRNPLRSQIAGSSELREYQKITLLKETPLKQLPALRKKRARHSVTEWSVLARCPRSYEWTYVFPRKPSLQERKPSLEKEALDATTAQVEIQELENRDLGTQVHRFLETADWQGLREYGAQVAHQRLDVERLIQWAQHSQVMQPQNLAQGREVMKELAFEIPLNGVRGLGGDPEVLVGSIDRLVMEEKQGELQIHLVDFKVAQKRKSPRFIAQSYSTQIHLYAWAIQCLEPRAKIKASVVHISPDAVQEVLLPLSLSQAQRWVESFLQGSSQVIAQGSSEARPGGHCQVCPHQWTCSDAVGQIGESEELVSQADAKE